jgi:hypothetical protein
VDRGNSFHEELEELESYGPDTYFSFISFWYRLPLMFRRTLLLILITLVLLAIALLL